MRRKRAVTLDDLSPAAQAQVRDQLAIQATKLEYRPLPAPEEQNAVEALASPVRIHLHQKRKRLVDIDNVYAKAVIDGIRSSGLIADDSPAHVKEVTYSQEKSVEESTIITVETI